ncbi:MAG: hypothetical protein EAY68_08865 [Bacteroidetes bacterium]|nr:MAG: hypothetical protein EAY68_08865 [Bacteroidota bacterium]
MKLKITMSLLLTGLATALCAQEQFRDTDNNWYTLSDLKSENLTFNQPKPGGHRVNFDFFNLPGTKSVRLELSTIFQIRLLPNLDSLFQQCRKDLFLLTDSLAAIANSKRIDYISGKKPTQIRITKHVNTTQTYVLLPNELADLKMENDTLRIKFFTPHSSLSSNAFSVGHISIVLTDIGKLKEIPDTAFSTAMAILNKHLNPKQTDVTYRKNTKNHIYYAHINYATQKVESFLKNQYIPPVGVTTQRGKFLPNFHPSVQWVNGTLAANIAVGFRYQLHNSKVAKTYLYASWEPMFTATKNGGANNLVRNDFVTLRMREETNYESNKPWVFSSNVSIGYLVGRRGDFFKPNTFKIGLPAARSNMLQIEPELFFHNFFKGFSPSLKLTMFFD